MLRLAPLFVIIATGISCAQQTVHGVEATTGESFTTIEGIDVVIEGVQAPNLEYDGTAVSAGGARSRVALDKLIRNQALTLEVERARRLPGGSVLVHPRNEAGRLLAEILLEQGMVRLCLEEGAMLHASVLTDAQARAKAEKVGVWSRTTGTTADEFRIYRGASLGLYAESPEFDYSGLLDEIRDVGASHVAISSPRLMDDWRSNTFWPVDGRSASWTKLQDVTLAGRSRGLAVAYHPMILLRTGTIEHWRGDIAPTQPWLWFRNYTRFIGCWADLANDLGVSLLMVGAEFSSLEKHTGAWRAVIATVRSRFGGKLTYSANWDHLDGVAFWDALDFVGTTGFFSLTRKNDPTVGDLIAAWAPIKDQLLRFQATVGKPLLITEIGYPSQDGANRDPWDYFRYQHDLTQDGKRKPPDHGEQADCFKALFETWSDVPSGYTGLFVWNWWRRAEPQSDYGFSVFGKPAHAVIKSSYADLIKRERPVPQAPK